MLSNGFHTLPDNAQLYYEVHGQEKAEKTLVFLNGLSQSTLAWAGFLSTLTPKYKVILLDLVFQGQSSAPEHHRSFVQHAQDVADLLTSLNAIKVHIIGISYGGAVAQRFLVHHENMLEKGLILASFAYKTEIFNAHGLAWTKALLCGGYELMLDVMLPIVLSENYFENPVIPIETLKTARKEFYPPQENVLKLMQATAESGDFRGELAKVQVPVLVIAGEKDMLCTPKMNQDIAESFPNGSFVQIDSVGHTLNLEAIPQTLTQILKFVES